MSIITSCYRRFVPTFYQEQFVLLKNDCSSYLSRVYTGFSDHRCNDSKATDYLRSKAFFISNNPWEFARTLTLLGIIAAVGILLAKCSFLLLGAGTVFLSGFLILSAIHEHAQGNHLEKALQDIVKKPFSELKTIRWSKDKNSSISLEKDDLVAPWDMAKGLNEEQKPVFIAFRKGSTIKLYYFGRQYMTMRPAAEQHGIKISCYNLLKGTEVSELLP